MNILDNIMILVSMWTPWSTSSAIIIKKANILFIIITSNGCQHQHQHQQYDHQNDIDQVMFEIIMKIANIFFIIITSNDQVVFDGEPDEGVSDGLTGCYKVFIIASCSF